VLQRKRPIALSISVVAFVVLAGIWLTLNHFRVLYYNSGVEGPSSQTSPYLTIVRIQEILHWPIVLAALCVAVLLLFELARHIALAVSNREPGAPKR
jgi:hypothetical protein